MKTIDNLLLKIFQILVNLIQKIFKVDNFAIAKFICYIGASFALFELAYCFVSKALGIISLVNSFSVALTFNLLYFLIKVTESALTKGNQSTKVDISNLLNFIRLVAFMFFMVSLISLVGDFKIYKTIPDSATKMILIRKLKIIVDLKDFFCLIIVYILSSNPNFKIKVEDKK